MRIGKPLGRLLVASFFHLTFGTANLATSDEPAKTDQKETIRKLIEQLGDPNYSKRELAKLELERIGYVTLDQLNAASFHPDPHIANTARFMVNSNQFSWTSEFDTPKVKEILSNFAASESDGKAIHIDELARLEREEGLPGLCRLARYESNAALAKRAAIHVLKSKGQVGQPADLRIKRISALLEGGESQSSKWILRHINSMNRFDLDFWNEQIESEAKLFQTRSPETNEFVFLNLGRWIAEQCASQPELREQSIAIAKSLVDQLGLSDASPLNDKSSKAIEFAQWALGAKFHEAVPHMHSKLKYRIVKREPTLSYYLAESYLQAGKKEIAERIAKLALEGKPSAADGSEWKESVDEANDLLRTRLEGAIGYRNQSSKEKRQIIGEQLSERGLFEWAEREFKLAADDDLTLISTLTSLLRLSELQHSLERYSDARDTLGRFQSRYENEKMFRDQMQNQPTVTSQVLSFYYLYAGDAALDSGDPTEAFDHFYRSLELAPDNVDALIGMYKLTPDSDQSKRRQTKHKQITELLRLQVRELEDIAKQIGGGQFAAITNDLVIALNSYAWAVANTEGDVEQAIAFSRQAVATRPNDSALLDTLAHCYFAAGRWTDAVEQQRKAVELKPHSPTMRRALERFEARLKSESQSTP
ncbi:tetratricopeptide repeat protein [Pirellulaceae bacterium SH449]